METFRHLGGFVQGSDGAVTVDWIVLTAAVIGLGFAALSMIRGGMSSLTSKINSQMSAQSISTTF